MLTCIQISGPPCDQQLPLVRARCQAQNVTEHRLLHVTRSASLLICMLLASYCAFRPSTC